MPANRSLVDRVLNRSSSTRLFDQANARYCLPGNELQQMVTLQQGDISKDYIPECDVIVCNAVLPILSSD